MSLIMLLKRARAQDAARGVLLDAVWQRWLQPRLVRAREVLSFSAHRASGANLTQVAASLTFSTVLSMVPLLAVALALFTVFPLFGELRNELEKHLLRDLLPEPFATTILRYLNDFASKATRVGEAGLAVFALTALTTVLTIDHALNDIWRVQSRRGLLKRLLVYGSLITVGPVLISASLMLTSMVATISMGLLHQLPPSVRSALSAAPVLFSCAAFTTLYIVVPNRRVDWRDALTGGAVAAILAEVLSRGFALYVSRGSVLTVYGAFAVLPIFLLWVYFSWLTVLFGAAIAATVSGLRATRFSDERRAGDRFVTALGLLKLLLEAQSDPACKWRSTRELSSRVRGHEEETGELLVQMQRLGYVRTIEPLRTLRSARWVCAADPDRTDLTALFHHFGIDPDNSLLQAPSGLGLDAWLQPVLHGAWLKQAVSAKDADTSASRGPA